jgi:hypothetical protein
MKTVNDLLEICKEEVKNGNGDRCIMFCVNDNEFYPLNSGFSSPIYNKETIYVQLEELNLEEDEIIILN